VDRVFSLEWFRPETGDTIPGASVDGGSTITLDPPFNGMAILYLNLMQ